MPRRDGLNDNTLEPGLIAPGGGAPGGGAPVGGLSEKSTGAGKSFGRGGAGAGRRTVGPVEGRMGGQDGREVASGVGPVNGCSSARMGGGGCASGSGAGGSGAGGSGGPGGPASGARAVFGSGIGSPGEGISSAGISGLGVSGAWVSGEGVASEGVASPGVSGLGISGLGISGTGVNPADGDFSSGSVDAGPSFCPPWNTSPMVAGGGKASDNGSRGTQSRAATIAACNSNENDPYQARPRTLWRLKGGQSPGVSGGIRRGPRRRWGWRGRHLRATARPRPAAQK